MRNNPIDIDHLRQQVEKLDAGDDDNLHGSKCLVWDRGKSQKGYGVLWVNGATALAHRTAYSLYVSKIPKGMMVCHRCDNPSCYRPCHLFLGTAKDNTADMVSKDRHMAGERCPTAKLKEPQIRTIRAEYASGRITQSALAKRFCVGLMTINKIVRRKSWAHVI